MRSPNGSILSEYSVGGFLVRSSIVLFTPVYFSLSGVSRFVDVTYGKDLMSWRFLPFKKC